MSHLNDKTVVGLSKYERFCSTSTRLKETHCVNVTQSCKLSLVKFLSHNGQQNINYVQQHGFTRYKYPL